MPALTSADVLTFLLVLAAAMGVLVLYHLLFIVVDVRRMVRQARDVSEQVEGIIMKPLSVADQAMQWAIDFLEQKKKKHHGEHHHHE